MKQRSLPIFFMAVILPLAIILSGCGGGGESDNEATTNAILAETEADPAFPVTVVGVTFDAAPRKIVCLSPALVEIIYEYGEGGRIAGRGSFCDFPAEVSAVVTAGSNVSPDIEKIKRIAPNVLLTSSPLSTRDESSLSSAGIKTIVIPSPTDLDEFREVFRSVAAVLYGTGGAEKADEAFAGISKVCNNADVLSVGKFLYVTEGLRFAGEKTLESAFFSCFGENAGKNVRNYGFASDVAALGDVDVVFLNNKYTLAQLRKNKDYATLPAVKSGRVALVDGTLLERPSGRVVELISAVRANSVDS